MTEFATAIIGLLRYLTIGFLMYGFFILLERIRPVEKHQPIRGLWFNLRWYVLYVLIGTILMEQMGIGKIVTQVQSLLNAPYITVPTPNNWWQYCLIALFYFAVVDFFYYWFHRWQHTTAFLWEQHKFHHSETSLNVTTTRRVHWLEDPLLVVFLSLPMGILFDFSGVQLGILTLIEILWLQFIHTNLKLGFGKVSWLLTSPQHHRIHHSFQTEHLDKNFAAFFPLWDILFGTYYQPQPNEFPPTGLLTKENYDNLWVASMLPFKAWIGQGYFRVMSNK